MENNLNGNLNQGTGNFNNIPQLPPKNYLVESILITVLCCLPFGIMGIMNATKVEGLFAAGDHEGAQRAADEAKKYCKYALIAGGIVAALYIIYIVIMIIIGVGAAASGY